MAVRNLGRTFQSSVEVTISGNPPKEIQTYTQEWLIKIDDPCTEEGYIGSAPGLPVVGQRSTEFPSFFCLSRSFSESTDSPGLYSVQVTWSTDMSKFLATETGSPASGGSGTNDNYTPQDDTDVPPKTGKIIQSPQTPPWERPAKWRVSTTYMKTVATHAILCGTATELGYNGDGIARTWPWSERNDYIPKTRDGSIYFWLPVTNSANEDVFIDKESAQLEYTASFAVRTDKIQRATQPLLLNCINSENITMPVDNQNYGIGEVWYKGVNITTDFFDDGLGVKQEVFYNVEITLATNTNPGGWRIGLADIGGRYYYGGLQSSANYETFFLFEDENKNPVKGKLNGLGDKAANQQEAETIWWSTKQFANLQTIVNAPNKDFG